MKLNQFDIEQLDRYLRNEMITEDRTAFAQRLESEVELKEALDQLTLIQEGLRLDDLKQKKEMLEEYEKEIEEDKKTNLFGIGWKWSVAATILLIVTAWLIWPKPVSLEQELFASNFEPLELSVSDVRSGTQDPGTKKSANFTFATKNYIIGRYDLAAPALLKVYEEERDTLMLLHAGIAFLADGRADKAIEAFDLVKKWPEKWEDDQLWYRAMAYLEKGEAKMVKRIIEHFLENEGKYLNPSEELNSRL